MNDAVSPNRRLPCYVAAAIFLSSLVVYAGYWHSRDWNVTTRLLLTFSLVQDKSVEVTPFVLRDGRFPSDPPTRDLAATPDGRLYCDKAPGQSIWGIPIYASMLALGQVEPYPHGAPAKVSWPADYWVTLGSSGLLTAASAVLIASFVVRLGGSGVAATATAGAYAFATIAFPYATLNYGHAAAGFFSLASLTLLFSRARTTARCGGAGLLAGLAVATDYPQVVFPLCAAISLVFEQFASPRPKNGWSSLSAFILGGIPAVLLLGGYHYLATGSPFRLPYSFELHEEFAYHRTGWGLPIGWPKWDVVVELLVGRRRGLLWFSPILVVAPFGLWKLARQGEWRLAFICTGVFVGLLWINAGFPMWDGGWSAGPRFLSPAIPLLMISVGVWLANPFGNQLFARASQALWGLVAVASAVAMVSLNTAGGRVHPNVSRPWTQFVLKTVEENRLEPTYGQWLQECALDRAPQAAWTLAINFLVVATAWGVMLATAAIADRRYSRTTVPVSADS